jgi:hypothetical protein
MAANRDLRAQLDERVHGALAMLLARFGLAAVQVDTLALRHDKFDANRGRVGSLWLAADERHAEAEHARHLDELYTEQEWQALRKVEQQGRLKHRRAELTLEEAEQAQALRAREIDLYARVADADSRKQAIDRGAGDMLAELEHELAGKAQKRAGETVQWAHVRELARIRMRSEIEVAQQDAQQARQLAQQRFSHQLLQQQVRNKIEQALAIEDAARQRAELVRLHEAELVAAKRAREIEEAEHDARRQSLALAHAARRREAERIMEWDEEVAQGRKRELLRKDSLEAEEVRQKLDTLRRGGAAQDAIAQHEKLLRTIEADALHRRRLQEVELDAEARRHAQRREAQEAAWQQELRRLGHDIDRARAIGALDDSAKLALADPANAGVLGDYLKTRVHAGMSADQMAALAGVVAATNSVTPQQAAALARDLLHEERGVAGAQADKERQHQLDLLALQNDVNKAALASHGQLAAALVGAPRLPAER